MLPQMLEKILGLAKQKAEQAEVYQIVSRSTPVIFEANRLKSTEVKESQGVALRVVCNGRVGLASATDLRDINWLVNAAIEVASLGAVARFGLPQAQETPDVATFDPAVQALSLEEMAQTGQSMIDRVRAFDAEMLCEGSVSSSIIDQRLLNSKGADVSFRKTVMSAGVSGTLTRGTDILTIDEYASWGQRLAGTEIDEIASKAVRHFELASQSANAVTCSCPVVFTPKGVASVFLGSLQLALNGKVVLQGASPLGNRAGEQVFDPRLSLWDDGTTPFAPGSAPYDDEGSPTRRTTLIENGVVRGFVYDLQTAGLAGVASTGNGFRGLGNLPSPSYTSLIFAEGDATLEEMIADVKDGVLIDQVMGAWAGNVISGDFSGNIHLGYRIENGRVTGRIKDCMVAGNVFEALRHQIAAVGRPSVWEGGSVKLPPMYFRALSISAQE
jgi:PmbA protein